MTSSGDSYSVTSGTHHTHLRSDYHSHYLSGWCGTCGRKRGADGRCANCDAWWTSPLVQVGGPLITLSSLFLLFLVPLIQHHSYTAAYAPVLHAATTTVPPPRFDAVRPPAHAPAPFAAPVIRQPRYSAMVAAPRYGMTPFTAAPDLQRITERADAVVASYDSQRALQPSPVRTIPVFAAVPRPLIPQSPPPSEGAAATAPDPEGNRSQADSARLL